MVQRKKKKIVSLKKDLRLKESAIRSEQFQDTMCCPKCGKLLSMRIKPRQKLSLKMQKLMQQKKQNEKQLTQPQQQLLQRSLKCCNILVARCSLCSWKEELRLQSRKSFYLLKADLRQKSQNQRTDSVTQNCSSISDKMLKKKMKKKERKKKAAKAKLLHAGLTKQHSSEEVGYDRVVMAVSPQNVSTSSKILELREEKLSSSSAADPFEASAPGQLTGSNSGKGKVSRVSSEIHRRKMTQDGKQQLKKLLKQKKKESLSPVETLSHFLNSLK